VANHTCSSKFNEVEGRERFDYLTNVQLKQSQQFIVSDVSRRNQQQLPRFALQQKRLNKIRVLCNDDALFREREGDERLIGGTIALR
jgi:hypothetical protein